MLCAALRRFTPRANPSISLPATLYLRVDVHGEARVLGLDAIREDPVPGLRSPERENDVDASTRSLLLPVRQVQPGVDDARPVHLSEVKHGRAYDIVKEEVFMTLENSSKIGSCKR